MKNTSKKPQRKLPVPGDQILRPEQFRLATVAVNHGECVYIRRTFYIGETDKAIEHKALGRKPRGKQLQIYFLKGRGRDTAVFTVKYRAELTGPITRNEVKVFGHAVLIDGDGAEHNLRVALSEAKIKFCFVD